MPSKHIDFLSNNVICKTFWVMDPFENWMKALNLYSKKNAQFMDNFLK